MTARISMLLKSHAWPDMLPFSLCNKTSNSAHKQTPLSNDTIDSVLQQREVGRAKELSAPLVRLVSLGSSLFILFKYSSHLWLTDIFIPLLI
jgi:hypothetical protein